MHSKKKAVLSIIVVPIAAACLSAALTVGIMNGVGADEIVLTGDAYHAYAAMRPLLELMDMIEAEHYGKAVARDQLIDGALRGALASIDDPYARYYTDEEYSRFLEQLDGAYHGIGALVGQPSAEGVAVLKVYEDSPAEGAGLLIGDLITGIDGQSLAGLTLEEIERLFAGDDGAVIELTITRAGQVMDMRIVRGTGTTKRVEYKLLNQYTGFIRLDKFSGTAAEEFIAAVRDLTDRGMRSLVVDLRNNSGGDLNQVVEIADMLLWDCVVVTVKHRSGEEEVYRSDNVCTDVPLAVLVNENSASASEILAAAVQENGRGIIVGRATYGKGVVQTTRPLVSNGGWVKLTTAAYYTPLGNSVETTGVTPDVMIDLADAFKALPLESINTDDDAQLWAALDALRSVQMQSGATEQSR